MPPEVVTREIVVVSGLPRSGTSLMMKMLASGGLTVLTDGVRAADEDNPGGYFETELVKKLPAGDGAWLAEARGKAVKVVSELLRYLPDDHRYRVVFMDRRMSEVLASQGKILARTKGRATPEDGTRIAAAYERHLARVEEWLAARSNFAVLRVDYGGLVTSPDPWIEEVRRFLDAWALDAAPMRSAIDPALYRNRA